MRRLSLLTLLAAPVLAQPAPPPAANAPAAGAAAPAPAAEHQESLRDLRSLIAQGKLKAAPALCDKLQADYENARAEFSAANSDPAKQREATIAMFMACYCIYAKAQVYALQGNTTEALAAFAQAKDYRTAHPEFQNTRLMPMWKGLDVLTSGLILEKQKKLDDAVQNYLPASYDQEMGARATGRLAMIELGRGHLDKASSWAYIHADDPTSQYALAQIDVRKKDLVAAKKHANLAIQLIQKQLATGKEYQPIYFAEGPAIVALQKKLPALPPPKPKPAPQQTAPKRVAPKPTAPAAETPAAPATPPAAAKGDGMMNGM